MDANDSRRSAADDPGATRPEQTFTRRISCAPPAETPLHAAPPRPGAHGTGRPSGGGDGR
jgi:hypothetical protein